MILSRIKKDPNNSGKENVFRQNHRKITLSGNKNKSFSIEISSLSEEPVKAYSSILKSAKFGVGDHSKTLQRCCETLQLHSERITSRYIPSHFQKQTKSSKKSSSNQKVEDAYSPEANYKLKLKSQCIRTPLKKIKKTISFDEPKLKTGTTRNKKNQNKISINTYLLEDTSTKAGNYYKTYSKGTEATKRSPSKTTKEKPKPRLLILKSNKKALLAYASLARVTVNAEKSRMAAVVPKMKIKKRKKIDEDPQSTFVEEEDFIKEVRATQRIIDDERSSKKKKFHKSVKSARPLQGKRRVFLPE